MEFLNSPVGVSGGVTSSQTANGVGGLAAEKSMKQILLIVVLLMFLDSLRLVVTTILLKDATTAMGLSIFFWLLTFVWPLLGVVGIQGSKGCLRIFAVVGVVGSLFFFRQGADLILDLPHVHKYAKLAPECNPDKCIPANIMFLPAQIHSILLVECIMGAGVGYQLKPHEQLHRIGQKAWQRNMYAHAPRYGSGGGALDSKTEAVSLGPECKPVAYNWVKCSSFSDFQEMVEGEADDGNGTKKMLDNIFGIKDNPLAADAVAESKEAVEYLPPARVVITQNGERAEGFDNTVHVTKYFRQLLCKVNMHSIKAFQMKTELLSTAGLLILFLIDIFFAVILGVFWMRASLKAWTLAGSMQRGGTSSRNAFSNAFMLRQPVRPADQDIQLVRWS